MVSCPHCGKKIASSAHFCPHCHLAVRQKRLSKMMTRLLSRPLRATTPPDTLAATTLPAASPPAAPTPNTQLTKQLQGSIQQFLRQERIITLATYTMISLIVITFAIVFGLGYLRSPTRAASSAATAIPTQDAGATSTTPSASATLAPSTGAQTPTAVASPAATTVVTTTPKKTATPVPTTTPAPTATSAPQVVLAIDAGGTGGGGYQSDADANGGKIVTTTHAIDMSLVGVSPPSPVLQSAREGTALTGTSFIYTIPQFTAGATYTVRLGFAEIDTTITGAGQRQFNVAINNQPALTNFDIIAQAGAPDKAIVQSFTATADTNGQITLVFSAGKAGVAIVNSIEIVTAAPAA